MQTDTIKIDQLTNENGYTFKKGQKRKEGRRTVKLISFEQDKEGNKYAHWQYILAATGKAGNKSTSFLTLIY